jgi:lipopolysaccharide/colanic/teichoic acid biosynthesis glycosyltransferase
VGHKGQPFTLYKFRSMVVGAEQQLSEVLHLNEREGGPLFKITADPRVTRLGKVLRATSIDELPQLINVVKGHMSLVGPRPALATEVARFDPEFAALRNSVRPGVTGLWQVEARDNPSFESYRYLDVFYAQNHSPGLDFAILLRTAGTVVVSSARSLAHCFSREANRADGTQAEAALVGAQAATAMFQMPDR